MRIYLMQSLFDAETELLLQLGHKIWRAYEITIAVRLLFVLLSRFTAGCSTTYAEA